jgi:hypothetical protein
MQQGMQFCAEQDPTPAPGYATTKSQATQAVCFLLQAGHAIPLSPHSTFPRALLPLSHEALAGCQWQLIANISSSSSMAVPVVGRVFSISRVPLTVVGCRVLRECRDSYIHRIVANASVIAVSTLRQETAIRIVACRL